jgi:hypothetical protein
MCLFLDLNGNCNLRVENKEKEKSVKSGSFDVTKGLFTVLVTT